MESDYLTAVFLGTMGFIFWVGGRLFAKYPPKKINFWYGYRTRTSMKNQETWTYAQKIAAQQMQQMGSYMVLCALGLSFFTFSMVWTLGITLFSAILFPFWMLMVIERKLKKKFSSRE
ncbi:MAG: SdpI family protein [Flavobacteriaceae bacterium]